MTHCHIRKQMVEEKKKQHNESNSSEFEYFILCINYVYETKLIFLCLPIAQGSLIMDEVKVGNIYKPDIIMLKIKVMSCMWWFRY